MMIETLGNRSIMFVCVCNALRESDITEAISQGVAPQDIHKCLGCTKACGRCIPMIEDYHASAAGLVSN